MGCQHSKSKVQINNQSQEQYIQNLLLKHNQQQYKYDQDEIILNSLVNSNIQQLISNSIQQQNTNFTPEFKQEQNIDNQHYQQYSQQEINNVSQLESKLDDKIDQQFVTNSNQYNQEYINNQEHQQQDSMRIHQDILKEQLQQNKIENENQKEKEKEKEKEVQILQEEHKIKLNMEPNYNEETQIYQNIKQKNEIFVNLDILSPIDTPENVQVIKSQNQHKRSRVIDNKSIISEQKIPVLKSIISQDYQVQSMIHQCSKSEVYIAALNNKQYVLQIYKMNNLKEFNKAIRIISNLCIGEILKQQNVQNLPHKFQMVKEDVFTQKKKQLQLRQNEFKNNIDNTNIQLYEGSHLVQVIDFDIKLNNLYQLTIIQTYVGLPLCGFYVDYKYICDEDLVALTCDILKSIEYLHNVKKIQHKQINPQNIYIQQHQENSNRFYLKYSLISKNLSYINQNFLKQTLLSQDILHFGYVLLALLYSSIKKQNTLSEYFQQFQQRVGDDIFCDDIFIQIDRMQIYSPEILYCIRMMLKQSVFQIRQVTCLREEIKIILYNKLHPYKNLSDSINSLTKVAQKKMLNIVPQKKIKIDDMLINTLSKSQIDTKFKQSYSNYNEIKLLFCQNDDNNIHTFDLQRQSYLKFQLARDNYIPLYYKNLIITTDNEYTLFLVYTTENTTQSITYFAKITLNFQEDYNNTQQEKLIIPEILHELQLQYEPQSIIYFKNSIYAVCGKINQRYTTKCFRYCFSANQIKEISDMLVIREGELFYINNSVLYYLTKPIGDVDPMEIYQYLEEVDRWELLINLGQRAYSGGVPRVIKTWSKWHIIFYNENCELVLLNMQNMNQEIMDHLLLQQNFKNYNKIKIVLQDYKSNIGFHKSTNYFLYQDNSYGSLFLFCSEINPLIRKLAYISQNSLQDLQQFKSSNKNISFITQTEQLKQLGKYQQIDIIGQGPYSIIHDCISQGQNNISYAIKEMRLNNVDYFNEVIKLISPFNNLNCEYLVKIQDFFIYQAFKDNQSTQSNEDILQKQKNDNYLKVNMEDHFVQVELANKFSLYLVMYKATSDLYTFGKQNTKLKQTWQLPELLRCSRHSYKALALLHKVNIIHGNLKPQNILIYQQNSKLHYKITDYFFRNIDKKRLFVPVYQHQQNLQTYQSPYHILQNVLNDDSVRCNLQLNDVYGLGMSLLQAATSREFDASIETNDSIQYNNQNLYYKIAEKIEMLPYPNYISNYFQNIVKIDEKLRYNVMECIQKSNQYKSENFISMYFNRLASEKMQENQKKYLICNIISTNLVYIYDTYNNKLYDIYLCNEHSKEFKFQQNDQIISDNSDKFYILTRNVQQHTFNNQITTTDKLQLFSFTLNNDQKIIPLQKNKDFYQSVDDTKNKLTYSQGGSPTRKKNQKEFSEMIQSAKNIKTKEMIKCDFLTVLNLYDQNPQVILVQTTLFYFKNQLYFIGGQIQYQQKLTAINQCKVYNQVNNCWLQVGSLNEAKSHVSVIQSNNKLYCFGGQTDNGLANYLIEKYSIEYDKWEIINIKSPSNNHFKSIYKFPMVVPFVDEIYILYQSNYGYLVNTQNCKSYEMEQIFFDTDNQTISGSNCVQISIQDNKLYYLTLSLSSKQIMLKKIKFLYKNLTLKLDKNIILSTYKE